MQILKVSDILPVMLKEMGSWKQARGGKKKNQPKQIISLFTRKITAAGWAAGMEWDTTDGLAQDCTPHLHNILAGVTVSSANNLLDKNITSALFPQTNE